MTTGVTTAPRPAPAGGARLSPKVRRLLRDNGLTPADVQGTGTRGRITPADVQRSTTGPGATRPAPRPDRGNGAVLASPLARRLLREAGVELREVAAPGPITRAVAQQVIAQGRSATSPRAGTGTAALDVDLTRVLHAVGAAHDEARRRWGIELTPLAPLTHALCRVLRRHPDVDAPRDRAGGNALPDVHLGVVVAAADGPVVGVVRAAQDLTVTGLAARAAALATDDPAAPAATFAVTGDGWSAAPVDPAGLLPTATGLLQVGTAERRSVTITDEFGADATTTRWIAPLRLTVDPDRVDEAAAVAFLEDLRRELESVDLLAAGV